MNMVIVVGALSQPVPAWPFDFKAFPEGRDHHQEAFHYLLECNTNAG